MARNTRLRVQSPLSCIVLRAMIPARRVDAPPSWPTDASGRLTAAMVAVASERGYAATRVTDVLARTGISSRTFYVHFANREACFLRAYDAIVADLARLLRPEPEPGAEADRERVPTTQLVLAHVLGHFARWPAHARVLLVEILSVGPHGASRHEQTMRMLSERLAACPQWQPGRCSSLQREEIAQLAIGAIVRMVQLRIEAGEARALPQLLPSLTALTTRVALAA